MDRSIQIAWKKRVASCLGFYAFALTSFQWTSIPPTFSLLPQRDFFSAMRPAKKGICSDASSARALHAASILVSDKDCWSAGLLRRYQVWMVALWRKEKGGNTEKRLFGKPPRGGHLFSQKKTQKRMTYPTSSARRCLFTMPKSPSSIHEPKLQSTPKMSCVLEKASIEGSQRSSLQFLFSLRSLSFFFFFIFFSHQRINHLSGRLRRIRMAWRSALGLFQRLWVSLRFTASARQGPADEIQRPSTSTFND